MIDGTGKFLIPGLWDMAVHVLWEPAIDTLLPLMIANGVTGAPQTCTRTCRGAGEKWTASRIRSPNWPALRIRRPDRGRPAPDLAGLDPRKGRRAGPAGRAQPEGEGRMFIKVYERLPREAYFAIADEAKRQGIHFAGHVPEAVTPAEASEAGQASIEHLSHFLEHCRSMTGRSSPPFTTRPRGRPSLKP